MRKSLRSKLLIRISIVAVVSLLLSGLFTFIYFKMILEQQIIDNDKTKLRQTARQLQYMSQNIANFTSFLIISDQLQTFFKNYSSEDTYGKFALTWNAIDFIQKHKGLNRQIENFIFVLPDGKVIWSEAQSDKYIATRMQEPWYQNYVSSGQNISFTQMHLLYPTGSSLAEVPTISYITKVRDINSGNIIGQLIINLDSSDFQSFLDLGSESFDGYLWVNKGGYLLFNKKSEPELIKLANNPNQWTGNSDESTTRVNGGIALTERFNENQSMLVSYTSMKTLLLRAQFAIYILMVFALTSTILALLLMMPIILNILRPIFHLYHAMNLVSDGNLHTSVEISSGDELEKLGYGFNRMVSQLRIHLEESIRLEKEKRDMEMELLLSQINPHFIYNTLNMIIYMAQKHKHNDIVRMTGAFITLLQDTVKLGEAQKLISLREEMKIVGEYMVIQSYRYQNMFDLNWDVQTETLDCLLPRNILQPLVENAIFHGIRPSQHRGYIHISAEMSNAKLIIQVKDNGVGIQADKLNLLLQGNYTNHHRQGFRNIGLENTVKRLERIYKGTAELRIESIIMEGTTITITLPQGNGYGA